MWTPILALPNGDRARTARESCHPKSAEHRPALPHGERSRPSQHSPQSPQGCSKRQGCLRNSHNKSTNKMDFKSEDVKPSQQLAAPASSPDTEPRATQQRAGDWQAPPWQLHGASSPHAAGQPCEDAPSPPKARSKPSG